NYFSILKTVAHGKTTFNEIVQHTGIPKNSVNKYLLSLQQLHLLQKKLPVTAHEKSKQGRYVITDHYFDFWFRFIFPNETFLEQNYEQTVHDLIWPKIDEYVSFPFEQVCREIVLSDQPFYAKIGSWWYQHHEIDIVALNEQKNMILFGECKWQKKKMDTSVYERLLEKKESVRWKNTCRKEQIVLFSKSGFTVGLEKIAEREGIIIYDLKKIKHILDKK
ncbi:MAG: DUF234 domain-containing protein, partial [Candidatus Thermoplasmatota archaeon]|nr:DUF234 domain-containing protein [Candidatus Thermoplasmatota archaeon]